MSGIADFQPDTLDLKVMQVEYTDNNGLTVAHVFGRDADGDRHHVEVVGHEPNFYIRADEYDTRVDNHYAVVDTEKHDGSGNRYRTVHGEPLVKVYVETPSQVGDMRDLFEQTWEADVLYPKRWLIDNEVLTGIRVDDSDVDTSSYVRGEFRAHIDDVEPLSRDETPGVEPRKVVVDIEVASESGYPSVDKANWPVSTIVAWDSYDEAYVGWLLEHDDHGEVDIDGTELDELRTFDDESDMLANFHSFVEGQSPDIITGWYSNDFDVPYLFNRSRDLNTYGYKDWSPLGEAFVSKYDPVVKGRECVDMLGAYKKTQIHNLKDKSLDAIAEKEGVGSKEDVVEGHTEMWKNEPTKFLKYNKVDAELVHRIDESRGCIDLLDNLRAVVGCFYSDIIGGNIDMMDVLFLRKAQERTLALPTAEKPTVGDYHGAYVFPPEPGLHEHCVYPDYSCFTEGHEVMTPEGPKRVEEMEVGDDVYTLDEETHELIVDEVVETHEYEHEGDVYDVDGTVGNMEITGNHHVYVGGQQADPYDAQSFDKVEISSFDGSYHRTAEHTTHLETPPETVHLPDETDDIYAVCYVEDGRMARHLVPDAVSNRWIRRVGYEENVGGDTKWTKYYVPIETFREYEAPCRSVSKHVRFKSSPRSRVRPETFDAEDLARLSAWYVSEGSLDGTNGIKIANESKEHLDSVCAILERYDIPYYRNESGVTFSHGVLRQWFVQHCGRRSRNKAVPEFVYGTTLINPTLDVLIRGDGNDRGSSKTYYTSSEALADDVARLAVECGYKPRIVERDRNEDEYGVYIRNGGGLDGDNITTRDHDGTVYCFTAKENHVVMAGRDGYFEWVGQSLYPYLIYQCNISPETIVGTRDDLEASEYTEDDCVWTYVDMTTPPGQKEDEEADEDDMEKLYFVEPSEDEGFIREVVSDVLGLADEYSGGMYAAVKRVRNSMYGVLGDSDSYGRGFRLFDWRLAEGTTLGGQKVLKKGADMFVDAVNDYDEDARVVGGDTDSFITTLPNAPDSETALTWARNATGSVNNQLDDYVLDAFGLESIEDASIELELESYSTRLFFKGRDEGRNSDVGVKKRYVQAEAWNDSDGWLDEPDVDIVGFEYVRSDVADITQDLQEAVFDALCRSDSPQGEATSIVDETIRAAISDAEGGLYESSWDLAKPFGIGQSLSEYGSKDRTPQPAYRGAKYANNEIYEADAIEEGSDARYWYVEEGKTGELRKTYDAYTKEDGRYVDAIAVLDEEDLPDGVRIDRRKMVQKTVVDPLIAVFRTMDWDTEFMQRAMDEATPPEYYRDEGQIGLEELM